MQDRQDMAKTGDNYTGEQEKIRVGAVSYLNTKPLLYGMRRSASLMERTTLIEEYPSRIAQMLIEGTIDVGLVPVAVIPKLKEWHIVSDYCIGASSNVASVCLFSETPIEKVEKVLLDYQSRTSVNLARVLLKHHWKLSPVLEDAGIDYRNDIKGTTAGVVIGDRALEQRKISPYIYDLAGEWIRFTGLPFVFAAWIANKQLPGDYLQLFNEANGVGLQNLEAVIAENPFSLYDLHTYYTHNIDYLLNGEKRQGLDTFLTLLETL